MISYQNVSIAFDGKTIINDFSTEIADGEKTVFSGPSGSGKSTLMSAILGFVPLQSGKILVDNLDVNSKNISKIRKLVCWLPQEIKFDFVTCRELFMFPYHFAANKNFVPTENQISDILNEILLPPDILQRKIDEISGGQRQRLLLASLLLIPKPVLMLDEPTSALDKASAGKLLEIIKNQKKTLVSSSHDPFWNENMDRVILMNSSNPILQP